LTRNPSTFKVPYPALAELLAKTGKFSGMRLHFRVNSDAHEDEFLAFQGTSYFRAVSKGQAYGLPARGLAIVGRTLLWPNLCARAVRLVWLVV
tara:strand:- start:4511 stop:4789 length:279 start_codon:yes stop_codon:yes gene_type:complete